MSVADKFTERFGADQTAAIMQAAEGHKNGVHDRYGSDPFKWALLICIGHDCMTTYKEQHGITVEIENVKAWALKHGDLASHDGDYDYIAAILGIYSDWIAK